MIREILVLALILTAYIIGSNRNPSIVMENNITLHEKEYIIKNGSMTCINYTFIPLQVNKYEIVNMTVFYNLSRQQFNELKNLKIPCNNIGCGEGAIRMKYACFDIFNIPHPKFSERPSVGYDPFQDQNEGACLMTENISGKDTIRLDNSQWYVWGGQKQYNLSFMCHGNNTWQINVDRTDEGWYNRSFNYSMDNLSFGNDSLWMPAQMIKELYLRHV
jgi:hypothetical protein